MSPDRCSVSSQGRRGLGLVCVVALLMLFAGVRSVQAQPSAATLPDGVSLPAKGGLYAIQSGTGGNKETVRLHPSQIVSNSHAGGNFARSMVYAGPHSSVELEGINSALHLQGGNVSFLVRLSDDTPEIMREQWTLIRLRQNETRRLVSTYSQNIFGGQHKRVYDIVPVVKADVENTDASWITITPQQPLAPGEYGLVLLPKDPNLFGGEVYDFNVDFDKAKPEVPTAGH